MMPSVRIERTDSPKPKPVASKLGFGQVFTDHMFLMDYEAGQGWHDPRVVPYAPLALDPASMVFHYGQAVFEGMKAYKGGEGQTLLFLPERNAERMRRSLERMSMPLLDADVFIGAVKALVQVDEDWIPSEEGTSLYIRPFVIATEASFGVRPSSRYMFAIVLSPVGAYFEEGLKPVDIQAEAHDVRAVRGGTGSVKAAANYAGSLKAQAAAKEAGCQQVLWLDALERKYVEEVGSMNVFFRINGEVHTPILNGSILEGVTRGAVLELLEDWDIPCTARQISIDELVRAASDGTLEEAFGTGTAAVISPIGGIRWKGQLYPVGGGQVGELSQKLYDTITGIQRGMVRDVYGWTVNV
ncbi:branched-chain amino acid aminotransferase [Paenibacillus sp. UNCCL117]|uniref:branched-chain amino acid aminotransferase n=1 Tax=unclassified Paenibacillus TaxID=185978 RepID=UPI00088EA88B|nr:MULTISPECIES: branched-chain amino acid aminotransferase [unclassified Paenibacillus]SDC64266.1 branched chain amino acid aminotransferase apoenzyme [Paenibacillus sp. cl123]SFW22487.1 branched-chain amino acid aminotransferase [Paenibacillus sp. UNCCL117]